MSRRKPGINEALIARYIAYLKEQERSVATLKKYAHDLQAFCAFLRDILLIKAAVIDWKQALVESLHCLGINCIYRIFIIRVAH